MRPGARRAAAALLAAAAVCAPVTAIAHPQGQRPVAYFEPDSSGVSFQWVIAQDEVRVIATHLGSGPVRAEALASSTAVVDYLRERTKLETSARVCEMAPTVSGRPVTTGWALLTRFECGGRVDGVLATVTLLHDVSKDYVTLWQAATSAGRARGAFTAARPSQRIVFASVTPVLPSPSISARPTGFAERVVDAVQSGRGLPFALLLALALGAAHALAPGHGKTIAAAVMISSGGRRQALSLAAAVASTHLLSVAFVSGAAVAAGAYALPRGAAPVMQVVAGALALIIAARMWAAARTPAEEAETHEHPHPHDRRSVVAGMVGGLVPSPGAVTIALVAFAAGRWVTGIAVIAAFSIGLAAVVFGIALLASRGRSLLTARPRTVRIARRMAAAAIGVSGVALIVTSAIR